MIRTEALWAWGPFYCAHCYIPSTQVFAEMKEEEEKAQREKMLLL